VIPLRDENPTLTRPVVNWLLVAACIAIYFLWQPTPFASDVDDARFYYENAAVPCEVVEGRPLTEGEIRATEGNPSFGIPGDETSCNTGSSESPEFAPEKNVWLSLLTSMFLHGDLWHLGGNMLFLWIFGNNIEDHFGRVRYILFYVLGGLAAAAAHIALNLDSTVPVVGASGAIAAVMGAYLVWFPNARVRTAVIFFLITVIDVRAKWLLGFWFVMQFFTSPNSGVAWAAHVGGFVFGAMLALAVRNSTTMRRAAWQRRYAPRS
jgi:membrane associated rhomboid family serine protease